MRPDSNNAGARLTVWIVEDSDDYSDAVRELIENEPDLTCPKVFSSGEDLLHHLNNDWAPQVLLVDIGLPGMDGIEVVNNVSRISPATEIVMVTIHENDQHILNAILAGARGYLLKTASGVEILDAIRQAAAGGAPLSPKVARRVLDLINQDRGARYDYGLTDREKAVLNELANHGGSKEEIGKALYVTHHTVDTHLRNIYRKLQVHSKTEAIVKVFKERLLD